MASKGFETHFSKLGPSSKMTLHVESSNFFHSERIDIDEKKYNYPIHIITQLTKKKQILPF
jgi:hypothetical protein